MREDFMHQYHELNPDKHICSKQEMMLASKVPNLYPAMSGGCSQPQISHGLPSKYASTSPVTSVSPGFRSKNARS
jgi:hypothetical protein